jgi:hypothetical protein
VKRLLAFVSLVAIATTASAPAFASETTKSERAPVHRHSSVAPADEYFGKLKMSVLGMRNTIADLGRRIDNSPEKAESVFSSTDYLEDSIRDWQKKYPHDTWLPRYVFNLAHLYAKVPSDEGRNRAKKTMAWLVEGFPRSGQAKVGREELASGSVGGPAAPPASGATPVTNNPAPQTSPRP